MKKEMNNKGFSLVELIIVIAIMAILIVVLAPQYLKYVEKSRNSTDVSNATEIVTAIQVYAADPDATKAFKSGESFTISVGTSGSISGGDADAKAAAQDAMDESGITLANVKCSSKSNWSDYTITGTVESNGSITFTYGSATGPTAFEDAMKGKSGS
jgi:type IV pilus assembly protein PilA